MLRPDLGLLQAQRRDAREILGDERRRRLGDRFSATRAADPREHQCERPSQGRCKRAVASGGRQAHFVRSWDLWIVCEHIAASGKHHQGE